MKTILLLAFFVSTTAFAAPHIGGLGKQIRPQPHPIIVTGPVINGRH